MPEIKLDSFLRADALVGATKASPKAATIVSVRLVAKEDLKFASDSDRWELKVLLDGQEYDWLANKNSMKVLLAAYGKNSDGWAGKPVKLYPVTQNVRGEMKDVVYAMV